ncbi:hypothetical protein RFI_08415 [Reticulomyxa filosa]|uniref:AAA+ ATPase domain-containing protein n=1 Tax=Reticulomyxa filosa TaxID=46433 RepID=X6NQX5_RETFI|nr:hypothetical protein RFI_08415 [Reticulomyxa filosa]|eukprot:ETO28710.1 hypothetical protein RFI_08415 [Reticulomyxa filosa]
MFQLLILRYLSTNNGQSFRVRNNHAFFVELPTQLSTTHNITRLREVLIWFDFFGERINESSIAFTEVLDQLRKDAPFFHTSLTNELEWGEKEKFVLQYINALDNKELRSTGRNKDWKFNSSLVLSSSVIQMLLQKYAPRAQSSLVQCKAFLQFMYRQLIQTHQFLHVKNCYTPIVDGRVIQLHEIIVSSLIKSGQYIACKIYENENLQNFILVEAWREADPPIVLLNQRSLESLVCFVLFVPKSAFLFVIDLDEKEQKQEQKQAQKPPSSQIDMDLQDETTDHSLSLLSFNLDKNRHPHAEEWRLVRKLHKWNLFNFEEDMIKKLTAVDKVGIYREIPKDQSEKLYLLLQICGRFDKKTEAQKEEKVQELLKQHNDYALTFDNILKIVAIFFRIKANTSQCRSIVHGSQGCGKTKLLQFMASVLDLTMTTIDVHGGYTIENLQSDLSRVVNAANNRLQEMHLVFLDEINTSPEIGAFKEVVCDRSLKGNTFPENMIIIAALNPHRRHYRSQQEILEEKQEAKNIDKTYLNDLERELEDLVYRVFPLPESFKAYIWNFGSLADMDEQQYISVMTSASWSNPQFTAKISTQRISEKELDNLKVTFIQLIFESQKFVRLNVQMNK